MVESGNVEGIQETEKCKGLPETILAVSTQSEKVQRCLSKIQDLAWKEMNQVLSALKVREIQADGITSTDRDSAVSTLRCLQKFYGFGADTFAAAVSMLDKFILRIKVKPKYLSCVTASCFFIASKLHEEAEDFPRASELSSLHRFVWTAADLKRMEKIILDKLSWNLMSVTYVQFLRIFCDIIMLMEGSLSEETLFNELVAKAEICINYTCCAQFKPSTFAVALVWQCLTKYGSHPVVNCLLLHLQAICQISDSELLECNCAISQTMEQYRRESRTHPLGLPLPKPIPRPNLVSRPSYYGSTDLPTIPEVTMNLKYSDDQSPLSGLEEVPADKALHTIFTQDICGLMVCAVPSHHFGSIICAAYKQNMCNISKS